MNNSPVKVLLIEDNAIETRVMEAVLEKAGQSTVGLVSSYQLFCTDCLEGGLKRLAEGGIDIVLLDLSLPDAHGLETLMRVREQEADVPVVVLTGMNDESLAVAAMQAGAQDYLVKGQHDSQLITRTIRYSIERHRLLRTLSLVDELTELYNRRGFLMLSEQHLKVAQRTGKDCLLVYLDLDGLKQINDTLGHHQGSQAIIDAANILRQTFRDSDIMARLGGDEFTVLVINMSDEQSDGDNFTARLNKNLEDHNALANRPYKLALSLGLAHYDCAKPRTLESLMNEADQAMYEQKRQRKKEFSNA